MRAGLLALLEQCDRDVAEPFSNVGMLLEKLSEANRAREPARSAADDRDADVDPRLGRIGGRADRVPVAERRWEIDRPGHRLYALAALAARAHELRELRDDLVQVSDDADVTEVEDRRV